jgi:hypothetical protein
LQRTLLPQVAQVIRKQQRHGARHPRQHVEVEQRPQLRDGLAGVVPKEGSGTADFNGTDMLVSWHAAQA